MFVACLLTCCACQTESLTTVLVTFVEDLPISVGAGNSSAPSPSVVPVAIPGVTLVADLPFLGEAIYRGTRPDQQVDDVCDLIMFHRDVETCESDTGGSIDQTAQPNDPAYPQQSYLNTTGVVGLWQQNVFGNPSVRIGIIDSGVDLNNPDILPSLWTNPNEQDNGKDNDNDGVPADVHCASFLGGVASGNCSDSNGVCAFRNMLSL